MLVFVFKRFYRLSLLLICGTLLAACSTFTTQQDYDPSRNFAAYHTWSWKNPAIIFNPDNALFRNQLTEQRIDQALQEQLPIKGLLRTTGNQSADINIQVVVADIKEPIETGNYVNNFGPFGPYPGYGPWQPWGYWSGPGFYQKRIEYVHSTLLQIDMYDAHDGGLIWRGRARNSFSDMDNPEERAQAIAELVHYAIANYPPLRSY